MMDTLARIPWFLHDLFWQGCQMLLVLVVAPAVVGLVRKIKARLLSRRGPPILQHYRELWRLLHKEAIVAETASPIFRLLPYAQFAATWVAAALIPTFATGLIFSWSADLIAIVALLGTARFALALAGMDVGTAFGGIGSSREMLFASLAEPAMLMITFTVALLAGTTLLSAIADHLLLQPVGLRISLALCLVALIIVALSENGRIPVDNPTTHLELTMVHEAMVLEYSGRHLAMIEAASAVKLTAYLSLVACLFVPYGMAAGDAGVLALLFGVVAWLAKLIVLAGLVAAIEVSIAKMRVFRVTEFVGGAFVLASLATLLLFVSRGF